MSTIQMKELFERYVAGAASEAEQQELFRLILLPEHAQDLSSLMSEFLHGQGAEERLPDASLESILAVITTEPSICVGRKVHFLKWGWAAAVLLFCVGYWWFAHRVQPPPPVTVVTPPAKPGAILTLADGRQVQLDSMPNGIIAVQNGTSVILKSGQLYYDGVDPNSGEAAFNTLSVPKGRLFRLLLPDGTIVWLNAASNIRYPTQFAAKERIVEVSGEAYFEVAQDAGKPFIVKADGREKIEVLGTHFNVHAYENEEQLNTTLVKGAIRVSGGGNSVVLYPGQQAQLAASLEVVRDIDIDKVVAWKNGLFDFEGMRLREVMRQLVRWYDIEVVYEGKVPDVEFYGKLKRNISLEELLGAFKDLDIHFRMEGRRLTVLP